MAKDGDTSVTARYCSKVYLVANGEWRVVIVTAIYVELCYASIDHQFKGS